MPDYNTKVLIDDCCEVSLVVQGILLNQMDIFLKTLHAILHTDESIYISDGTRYDGTVVVTVTEMRY